MTTPPLSGPASPLAGQRILITGAARRVGRLIALSLAAAGADLVLHHHRSQEAAADLAAVLRTAGSRVDLHRADLADPAAIDRMMSEVTAAAPLFALVNNAAIFRPVTFTSATVADWDEHLRVNLTAPMLLARHFAAQSTGAGRIINILDWRALRPGTDHLPYTISKVALAGLTRSLAQELAPGITVNGLALGAILPPTDGTTRPILTGLPAGGWAEPDAVPNAVRYLLSAPYVTGEILHIDGGRHLI